MKVTTSYKTKIPGYNAIFDGTLEIYRAALEYLIEVVNTIWETIPKDILLSSQAMFVERVIHDTSKRVTGYDFDQKFHKFPSYLRRSAISEAIGIVKSFRSNYVRWEKNKKQGNPPKLQTKHRAFPTMYKGNMYERDGAYMAKIKINYRNDWVWLEVRLRKSDVDYIFHHKAQSKELSPTLIKKGKNWWLRFTYEDQRNLPKYVKTVTTVDLGINNAATCSAMLPDGTIIGRKVIRFPIEQDRMEHNANKIKKAQKHGARKTPVMWAHVNCWNRALSERTAGAVIEFALKFGSDAIIVEHLDLQGKKHGKKKQKLHLWRKKTVIGMLKCKAHLNNMRVSTVNAMNTSALAFDGSGPVERGKYLQNGVEVKNYSMCTFANGKIYHCDLNATYNIGARYFIREILKSLPETERLEVEAKVPQLSKRTTCTLSDLISLDAELKRMAASVLTSV